MLYDPKRRPQGNQGQLEGVWAACSSGRLPHSLLLTGREGTGKFLSALWIAAGMMCDQGPFWPCGRCGPCKRSSSGNHPDIFVVDGPAVGQSALTIGFITPRKDPPKGSYSGPSIDEFLSLRSMEGGWKVVIVRESERMNEAAQNAFLKTLEEPGPQVLLLLETSRPARLLDTIKSRVVQIGFGRLSPAETEAVLVEEGVEGAGALSRWSMGSPGLAMQLAHRGAPEMRDILLRVCSGSLARQEGAAAVWAIDGDYPGKTPAAQKRLRAEVFLDVGLEVWLDLERSMAGAPLDSLAHGDRIDELPPLAEPHRRRRLSAWMTARKDVELNMTPEALVDRALLASAQPG